jgi:hypothetical protein
MRIVYVLGLNRSGSTVFERTLGSIDGVFAAGEVHNLFLPPGLDRTCGCGETLAQCEVWSKVVAEVEQSAGQPIHTFMTRVGRLQARTGRSRHVANIVRGTSDAKALAGSLHTLYAAIGRATGSDVVTDSSKTPAGALLLRLMPVEFTVVDLSREEVATIQSNEVARTWDNVEDAAAPPLISGGRLAATQASLTFAARVLHAKVVPISFEDFLSDPAAAASALPVDVSGLRPGNALARTHQCEGNPSRFGTGELSRAVAHPSDAPSAATRVEAAAISVLRRLSR